jgi:hypothetical protein
MLEVVSKHSGGNFNWLVYRVKLPTDRVLKGALERFASIVLCFGKRQQGYFPQAQTTR